ncbi:galactose mutarotase [Cryobacterium sp. TMT2-15-1]|uniref:aldose 1-epimerase family protein n=1 Tax=Cryobacterium sp. TMT2-15-1 TaxID=1259246 RepID=UPI0010697CC2|nr:aldose 1-epimerase family protein [Cryobacterium sp. TMT2-15-1]TFC56871.1 galactose mutarotase [Cryobacterium sp. TMT2-15-1]
MTEPSRAQYEISAHGYRAVVTGIGATLRVLQHDSRDLIVSFAEDQPMVNFRGALAAPWPNRVADGRYHLDGMTRQLLINEPSRDCALHGLVFDRDWQLVTHSGSEVVLGVRLPAGDGYPFQLDLVARYLLSAEGLTTTVEATNSGTGTAPYGVCPHPYLRAGDSPLDSWQLSLPAGRYLRVTPDRLLPVGLTDVDGGPFDFRQPRPIGSVQIDHAFTALVRDADGVATVELREAGGSGVTMSWGTDCPWLQIHTADLPAPGINRLGLAVEPMTCPPDAFNSGTDLIRLMPGESHRSSWIIAAIT